jgi:hypothetical protein
VEVFWPQTFHPVSAEWPNCLSEWHLLPLLTENDKVSNQESNDQYRRQTAFGRWHQPVLPALKRVIAHGNRRANLSD